MAKRYVHERVREGRVESATVSHPGAVLQVGKWTLHAPSNVKREREREREREKEREEK